MLYHTRIPLKAWLLAAYTDGAFQSLLYSSESTGSAFSLVLLRNVCDLGANAEAAFSAAHPMSLICPSLGISVAVVNEYQRADALVRVSVQEGIPNAVVEGVACGLPIVVSRVSDLSSLLRRVIMELPVMFLIQWI